MKSLLIEWQSINVCVAFVGAQYPHHFPIRSEGPVDMLPEEREFHRNKDEGEEYVWKSNSQIRNLLKQVQFNNIFPEMIEEDADIAGIQNADRTNPYKLPTDRLRYLALHYGLNLAKKKQRCKLKTSDVPLTDNEMMDLLESEGIPANGATQILANLCKSHNLPVTRTVQTGIIPCWEGKPKGLINICVEHGLCHLQKVLVHDLYYTKRGKKDAETGDIDESTSFVSILSDCADFKKEFSILKKIAERFNSMIWFTPKYHCEIAGEGVEYM